MGFYGILWISMVFTWYLRLLSMIFLADKLRNDIAKLFRGLREDPKLRVVILTGAGQKAFSAGVDLLRLLTTCSWRFGWFRP